MTGGAKSTPVLPRVVGPYRPSASAGGLLFLSGQVGKAPNTTSVTGDVAEQTRACLLNLETVLATEGLDASALVKCNVYLVDIADFDAMNTEYERVLADHRPARTTVAVAALPLGARVEIEAIAACATSPSGGSEFLQQGPGA